MKIFSMKFVQSIVVLMSACLSSYHATAQFSGDLFFEPASSSLIIGENLELDLNFFAGANPFGAIHAILSADDGVEFIDVKPGRNSFPDSALTTEISEDKRTLSIVLANGINLDGPIGTVNLAKIVVQAKSQSSGTVFIDSETIEAISPDGEQFASLDRGLSASIAITNTTQKSVSFDALSAQQNRSEVEKNEVEVRMATDIAKRVAPLGATTQVKVLDSSGRVKTKTVTTTDSAAAIE